MASPFKSLRDVMSTDFKHRGVPWTRLLLQEGPNEAQNRLNLRASERLCTALAGLDWLALLACIAFRSSAPLLVPLASVPIIALLNREFYQFVARERGLAVALAMIPLHLLYYATNVVSVIIGWTLHILLGEPSAPVTVAAAAGMDLETWPPGPSRPSASVWDAPARPPRRRHRPGTHP